MKSFGRYMWIGAGVLASVLVVGCEREGPAERAGEKLDRAVENTGDSLERAGDRARDRVSR